MNGNLFIEAVIWFFAIAGCMLLLCDLARYFMFRNTLPEKMTLLIPAEALGANCRAGIANLLNLLYEQNPDGNYELIVLDNAMQPALAEDIRTVSDVAECVYIANSENVAAYIKQSFQ